MREYIKRVIAAVAAMGALTAVLPTHPAVAAPVAWPCTAEVKMTLWDQWHASGVGPSTRSTGIVATFAVTNNSIAGITDFRMTFMSPRADRVLATWGETITPERVGVRTLYVVTPHGGNPNLEEPVLPEDPNLPPGRTIEFGYQGELAGRFSGHAPETVIYNVYIAGRVCEVFYV